MLAQVFNYLQLGSALGSRIRGQSRFPPPQRIMSSFFLLKWVVQILYLFDQHQTPRSDSANPRGKLEPLEHIFCPPILAPRLRTPPAAAHRLGPGRPGPGLSHRHAVAQAGRRRRERPSPAAGGGAPCACSCGGGWQSAGQVGGGRRRAGPFVAIRGDGGVRVCRAGGRRLEPALHLRAGRCCQSKSASRSLRRALLTSQVKAGSIYRCGRRT